MQDFLAQIGGGVIGGFRFNALTQQYESFTPGAPAFVNQLQTLNRGDALLLNMQLTGLVEQVDLLAGGARQIALQTGSNLVSYTGASGPIAAILADLATLTAAFVFDAPTQQWLAYRPGAAAFLNQVSTLERLQAVFLILSGPATWTYTETTAGAGPGVAALPAGLSFTEMLRFGLNLP